MTDQKSIVVQEERVVEGGDSEYRRVERSQEYVPSERERALARFRWLERVAGFFNGLIATVILFRFTLLMLGANPQNWFAQLVYQASEPLVAPFLTLFGASPTNGVSVLEFPDFIAIAVYSLLIWGGIRFIKLIFAPSRR